MWKLIRSVRVMIFIGITIYLNALGASAAEGVVKIGAAISLSGSLSREGGYLHDGYELWKRKVNAGGGILVAGKRMPVEIIYYDDESNAQTSARLTEKLITQDKVDFLFGPYSSGIGTATTAIGERYKILTMAPMATANSIYARGFKYVFTGSPLADTGLHSVLVLAMTASPKPKTVAIVGPDDLFPNLTSAGAVRKAKELGLEVVYQTKYPKAATDLSAVVTAIKGAEPDIIVCSGYAQDSILLVKALHDLNVKAKMIGLATAVAVPDFRGTLGPIAEDVVGAEYWVPTETYSDRYFKNSQAFSDDFKNAFGHVPIQHAATGASAAIILQMAIEKANSLKSDDVRAALLSLNGETFFGPFKFEANGTNSLASIPVLQIQGGEPKVVYPEAIRQVPLVYPMVSR